MARAMRANGTQIFVADPNASDPKAYKLCATAIELNEGEPSKIDITTLCETQKTQEIDGLLGSSSSSITFNFDPQSEVQKMFWDAKQDKRELMFRACYSDGTSPAIFDKLTKQWKEQTDRTSADFTGQINTFPFSFAVNATVQPQVSINMTSALKLNWKTT